MGTGWTGLFGGGGAKVGKVVEASVGPADGCALGLREGPCVGDDVGRCGAWMGEGVSGGLNQRVKNR